MSLTAKKKKKTSSILDYNNIIALSNGYGSVKLFFSHRVCPVRRIFIFFFLSPLFFFFFVIRPGLGGHDRKVYRPTCDDILRTYSIFFIFLIYRVIQYNVTAAVYSCRAFYVPFCLHDDEKMSVLILGKLEYSAKMYSNY